MMSRALVATTLSHGTLNPVCGPGHEGHQVLISYKMHGAWGKVKNEALAWLHIFFSVLALSLSWQHCSGFADLDLGDRVARNVRLMSHAGQQRWSHCSSWPSAKLSLSLKLLLIFPNEVSSRSFPMAFFMWTVWGRAEGDHIRFSCSLLQMLFPAKQPWISFLSKKPFLFNSCTKEWGFLKKGSIKVGNFHSSVRKSWYKQWFKQTGPCQFWISPEIDFHPSANVEKRKYYRNQTFFA